MIFGNCKPTQYESFCHVINTSSMKHKARYSIHTRSHTARESHQQRALLSEGNGSMMNQFGLAVRGAVRYRFGLVNCTA
jgi:hypothetical protein